jgi:hypothetical protein
LVLDFRAASSAIVRHGAVERSALAYIYVTAKSRCRKLLVCAPNVYYAIPLASLERMSMIISMLLITVTSLCVSCSYVATRDECTELELECGHLTYY